ncbi:hypothetical protein [Desulfovibrio subterraneus]|uniref:Uncharacterized protein n=1 Tax=Desulfovibrio subterraneus TaxID=2718620 RepID=A0A7J0BM42_9BACT|nr:hypothetical protein [Desulfovibrio subterraneus]GFM34262.1 hypothetical protein DSM101010T_26270 [Desulfovibrio subterraneus]
MRTGIILLVFVVVLLTGLPAQVGASDSHVVLQREIKDLRESALSLRGFVATQMNTSSGSGRSESYRFQYAYYDELALWCGFLFYISNDVYAAREGGGIAGPDGCIAETQLERQFRARRMVRQYTAEDLRNMSFLNTIERETIGRLDGRVARIELDILLSIRALRR